MNRIEYRVNDVTQETEHRALTAKQILKNAGIDSELHYLEETHPEQVSYKEKAHEEIALVNHMRFRSEHQLIDYKVNDEKQETRHLHLSARQILVEAGIDPGTNYLSEISPEHISFEGKPDETIRMHSHMKFISVSIKPTPVSER